MEATDILAAGGLLPNLGPVPDTDTVDALGFAHPAIASRTIVRLVPDELAAGVQAEMELFGFVPVSHANDIARQRRRMLGFPGWALVHEPARAKYALDVTKRFFVHKKKATTKPGHARDGFGEIADELARKAPTFLPSYWEEAGRAFVDVGNLAYAATAFDKAREAERTHALPIDAEARGATYLEFALAGALTVKSLQAYGKELSATLGPDEAYRRFYDLCVRRTLGGLKPWASLPKDLRAVAKAAKKDVAAEERRFVRDIYPSAGAARGGWDLLEAYDDAITAEAAANPEFRRSLLQLEPDIGDGDLVAWVGRLEKWGCFADIDAETAAGWLSRASGSMPGSPAALIAAAKAVHARLGGATVTVRTDSGDDASLDLVDWLIERGIPMQLPEDLTFDLRIWAGSEATPDVPRDPVYAAADPRTAAAFQRAVNYYIDEEEIQRAAIGKRAFDPAIRTYLAGIVEKLASVALPHAAKGVETLESLPAELFAAYPDLVETLRATDIAVPLQRTLQGLVPDELGWPAFDDAAKELGADDLEVVFVWPRAILHDGRRAIVVGAEGRLLEHDFRLPKKSGGVRDLAFAGGQLYVEYDDVGPNHAYWSGNPNHRFESSASFGWSTVRVVMDLPDGRASEGGTPYGPGDADPSGCGRFDFQGTTAWKQDDDEKIRPIANDTGDVIETGGPPPFLADGDDGPVNPDASWYLPGTSDLLGSKDGMTGLRAITDPADGAIERWIAAGAADLRHAASSAEYSRSVGLYERTDGLRVVAAADALAILTLPGDPRPRLLVETKDHPAWLDPDGRLVADEEEPWHAGSAVPLPVEFLPFTRLREPSASALLRQIGLSEAQALLAMAREELDNGSDGSAGRLAPRIGARLGVHDERLCAGIAGMVDLAAQLANRVAARVEAQADAPAGAVGRNDEILQERWQPLYGRWGFSDGDVVGLWASVRRFLAGEAEKVTGTTDLEWWRWLDRLGATSYLALAPGRAPDAGALAAAKALITEDLAGLGLRAARVVIKDKASPALQWTKDAWGDRELAPLWTRADGASRWVFVDSESDDDADGPFHVNVVGRGELPAGVEIETAWPDPVPTDRLQAVIAASEGRDPAPLPSAAAVEAAMQRSGLSRGEILWLYAGFPGTRNYAADFLGKELRTTLGLKVAEGKAAKERLQQTPAPTLARVWHAAIDGGPTDLWDHPDLVLDRLITAWIADRGVRVPIPDTLVAEAKAHGMLYWDPMEKLEALMSASTLASFTTDGDWGFDADGSLVRAEGYEHDAFTAETLDDALRTILWLASVTPVGDPLRAKIPVAWDLLRARLASPKLLVDLGYFDGNKKAAEALFRSLSGKPYALRGDPPETPPETVDAGGIVAVLAGDQLAVGVRPSALTAADRAFVEKYLPMFDEPTSWRALTIAASPGVSAIVERIRRTPLPEGAWEQDPGMSAAHVVQEVREKLRLSEEAARLFLQILVLPAPSKKNVVEWNGWTNATYSAAATEIAAAGLVLEAKRARAGRDHFLPGGWVDRKKGPLPFESWKLPLYGATDEGEFPLTDIVPLRPWHELFEVGWARYRDGDRP